MTVAAQVQERSPQDGCCLEVAGLAAELRQRGFDLRRPVFVGYLLELGTDRDAAYGVRDRAAADGWQAVLYGDGSGWVVRLGRVSLARPELLDQDCRYAAQVARAYGGGLRGVCVEDVHGEDIWDALVAQLREGCSPPDEVQPHLPAPRREADAIEAARPLSRSA